MSHICQFLSLRTNQLPKPITKTNSQHVSKLHFIIFTFLHISNYHFPILCVGFHFLHINITAVNVTPFRRPRRRVRLRLRRLLGLCCGHRQRRPAAADVATAAASAALRREENGGSGERFGRTEKDRWNYE